MLRRGRNGLYRTYEKLAKAVPQPFVIDDIIIEVKEYNSDLADTHPNLANNIQSWISSQVRIGKIFKLPQNGGRCKKYSFDPADAAAITKNKTNEMEAKKEMPPEKENPPLEKSSLRDLVRFEVIIPANARRMTVDVGGVEYDIVKRQENDEL
ncbi:MAG: hypothetical protein HYV52_01155 [Parcubacteria group bacterium]|nr:hypothetical protein [Parcubacteria group bacterium]